MTQPPLPFDGHQLKALGMALAADAQPLWREQARAAIRALAATGHTFTSEDVTAIVGLPRGEVGQHRNNAVGAVMSAAARAGDIRRVDYEHSQRRVSHAAVLSRWVGV